MPWTDRDIVLACLKLYPDAYCVTSWPEESNRNAPEIDAYAEAAGAPPLALEVTKIESLEDQRFDDRRIEEIASSLEPPPRRVFPTGVDVFLPARVIRPGLDWQDIQRKLKDYLLDLRERLRPGSSRHSIPGVAFPIFVRYEPDLNTPFAFGRIAPPAGARRDALLSSMQKALRHKAERLRAYRDTGARAVLILESHDIALIDHVHVYAAFRRARRLVDASHLDDVWFCLTYNPHQLDEWYGFSGTRRVLDRVNLPNLRLGPKYDEYWEEAIRAGRV